MGLAVGCKGRQHDRTSSRRDQSHRVNWPFLIQNLVVGTNFSPCD